MRAQRHAKDASSLAAIGPEGRAGIRGVHRVHRHVQVSGRMALAMSTSSIRRLRSGVSRASAR